MFTIPFCQSLWEKLLPRLLFIIVLTLNRSFFVLKRDLYSNKIFISLPFPDKAEARFRVKTKLQ